MAQACCPDLRSRVIEAAAGGPSTRQAAERFGGHPDPAKLIVIDETGASTRMARLRGRAPLRRTLPGRRSPRAPKDHLRPSGMTAPMILDGATNGPAFLACVEQAFPKLNPLLRKAARASPRPLDAVGRRHPVLQPW